MVVKLILSNTKSFQNDSQKHFQDDFQNENKILQYVMKETNKGYWLTCIQNMIYHFLHLSYLIIYMKIYIR